MVIAQEPTQSLAALHGPLAADVCIAREQQDVALPLMISLGMEMFDKFAECAPQGALTQENHLGQTLLLHRANPPLRIGIQVRTPRGQASGSIRPDAMMARNDWVYFVSRSCRR